MIAHARSAARRRFVALALAVPLALAGCAAPATPDVPAAARAALAPTGTLRIAVYPGSPTSLVAVAPPESMRGVTVDLGRAFAQRLGVPSQIVVYPRVAEAVAALQRGEADFTITNASAERARLLDFAPTLLELESGLLVPTGSRLTDVGRMDQDGLVIGVSQGSSSERALGSRLRHATMRAFPTLDAARAALLAHEIDAFATNKAILFELSDRVPGSRVLEGRWNAEAVAPAIPKGREAGLPVLARFAQEVQADGQLERAAQRAGVRGAAPPAR